MSGQVKGKSVLQKSVDPERPGMLVCYGTGLYMLPVRPMGTNRILGDRPEWEFIEADGVLKIRPSLLDQVSQFHTAYDWQTEYEVCPPGVDPYTHFRAINPTIDPHE